MEDSIEKIAEEVRSCEKCQLCKGRTNAVPGDGDSKSDILFIGEGPGANEDKQGLPFVGAAGKYLNELLGVIGLDRRKVFIANVVKCRPPDNRDPLPEEVGECWPYLQRQIDVIRPKLIVTLGRHSMGRFIKSGTISEMHGQPKRIKGQVYYPVYHPAAALYRGSLREEIEKDFTRIPKVLKEISKLPDSEPVEKPKPKQRALL